MTTYAILPNPNNSRTWGIYIQRRNVSATVWDQVDSFLDNAVWDGSDYLSPRVIARSLQQFRNGRAALDELVSCFLPGVLTVRKDRRCGWRVTVQA